VREGPGQQQEREGEEKSKGAWAGPGIEKWAEPTGAGEFLIFQIKLKQARTILIKRWTYQAPDIPNKIWLESV
jgi:hypothetical protein